MFNKTNLDFNTAKKCLKDPEQNQKNIPTSGDLPLL